MNTYRSSAQFRQQKPRELKVSLFDINDAFWFMLVSILYLYIYYYGIR